MKNSLLILILLLSLSLCSCARIVVPDKERENLLIVKANYTNSIPDVNVHEAKINFTYNAVIYITLKDENNVEILPKYIMPEFSTGYSIFPNIDINKKYKLCRGIKTQRLGGLDFITTSGDKIFADSFKNDFISLSNVQREIIVVRSGVSLSKIAISPIYFDYLEINEKELRKTKKKIGVDKIHINQ